MRYEYQKVNLSSTNSSRALDSLGGIEKMNFKVIIGENRLSFIDIAEVIEKENEVIFVRREKENELKNITIVHTIRKEYINKVVKINSDGTEIVIFRELEVTQF